jgi:hypothetical protein
MAILHHFALLFARQRSIFRSPKSHFLPLKSPILGGFSPQKALFFAIRELIGSSKISKKHHFVLRFAPNSLAFSRS